jgi:hypothetical protein
MVASHPVERDAGVEEGGDPKYFVKLALVIGVVRHIAADNHERGYQFIGPFDRRSVEPGLVSEPNDLLFRLSDNQSPVATVGDLLIGQLAEGREYSELGIRHLYEIERHEQGLQLLDL